MIDSDDSVEKTTQLISVTKHPGRFVSDKPEENKMERKELNTEKQGEPTKASSPGQE